MAERHSGSCRTSVDEVEEDKAGCEDLAEAKEITALNSCND